MRACGILMPVASLPSKYGIGSFSKSAYAFVDTLALAGQKYWQILPLGSTGYGDSPYQSFSTYAGNSYFIDLDALVDQGLLTVEECESYDFGCNERYIDYEKLYYSRFRILKKAYKRSRIEEKGDYQIFVKKHSTWLPDYCLYMAVKNHFGGISWNEWDVDIRNRKPEAIEYYVKEFAEEIQFHGFLQYIFYNQWMALKAYANSKGINIIGDIPIYVAFDSADTWAHPELFRFNENNEPDAVAGCPPDGFSRTGQLWGNPLYDWEYHRATGYEWWCQRIAYSRTMYDLIRVDHFRGFDQYYAIPYGHKTAESGRWLPGPGVEFFNKLKERLGEVDIIAEDLGYQTPSVLKLLKDTGYPGMKVLEFAFDSREESDYLPHNYTENYVVYTGTHDNQTLQGWFRELSPEDREYAVEYLDIKEKDISQIHWSFVRAVLASVAKLAVIPIQDYLGLGAEARINQPSTMGGNWTWRLQEEEFTKELAAKIRKLVKLYGRL